MVEKKSKYSIDRSLYTKEEIKLIDEFENDSKKWKNAPSKATNLIVKMAENTSKQIKEKRITIRIRVDDLEKLKLMANEEGLPYQTMLGGYLHKIANRQIIDKKLVKEIMKAME